jgi:hypothetical protein
MEPSKRDQQARRFGLASTLQTFVDSDKVIVL